MKLNKVLVGSLLCLFLLPSLGFAQEATLVPDTEVFEKAKVLEVTNERDITIPGTDTPSKIQTLKAEVLS